jgi:hypothetical protein
LAARRRRHDSWNIVEAWQARFAIGGDGSGAITNPHWKLASRAPTRQHGRPRLICMPTSTSLTALRTHSGFVCSCCGRTLWSVVDSVPVLVIQGPILASLQGHITEPTCGLGVGESVSFIFRCRRRNTTADTHSRSESSLACWSSGLLDINIFGCVHRPWASL